MKGKLIKLDEGYVLVDDKSNTLGQTFGKFKGKKLSLKNCEAVANGYDLDELVHKFIGYDKESYTHVDEREHEAFINGFQKALEILGDKKFSEEDVKKAILLSMKYNDVGVIQTLQQTEWDVEIVMDICGDKVYAVPEPVLDADGCLILRRI